MNKINTPDTEPTRSHQADQHDDEYDDTHDEHLKKLKEEDPGRWNAMSTAHLDGRGEEYTIGGPTEHLRSGIHSSKLTIMEGKDSKKLKDDKTKKESRKKESGFEKWLDRITRWVGGTIAALAIPGIIALAVEKTRMTKKLSRVEDVHQEVRAALVAVVAMHQGASGKKENCRPRMKNVQCTGDETTSAGLGGDQCCKE